MILQNEIPKLQTFSSKFSGFLDLRGQEAAAEDDGRWGGAAAVQARVGHHCQPQDQSALPASGPGVTAAR